MRNIDSEVIGFIDDDLQEAIAELEELQNRSCASCKYYYTELRDCTNIQNNQAVGTGYLKCDTDFCCNKYELKG